jgi:hypothetical protein
MTVYAFFGMPLWQVIDVHVSIWSCVKSNLRMHFFQKKCIRKPFDPILVQKLSFRENFIHPRIVFQYLDGLQDIGIHVKGCINLSFAVVIPHDNFVAQEVGDL